VAKLPLDDPRWNELKIRNGSATGVPDILRRLLNDPLNDEVFADLWPELCSEDTAWSAAYAAIPYVNDIAAKRPTENRTEHLWTVGYVVMCTEDEGQIPRDLVAEYHEALPVTLAMLAESIVHKHGRDDTRYLLAACAALQGHVKLGELLANLDCGCPHCEEELEY